MQLRHLRYVYISYIVITIRCYRDFNLYLTRQTSVMAPGARIVALDEHNNEREVDLTINTVYDGYDISEYPCSCVFVAAVAAILIIVQEVSPTKLMFNYSASIQSAAYMHFSEKLKPGLLKADCYFQTTQTDLLCPCTGMVRTL